MSHEAYDLFKGMHKTRLDPTFGVYRGETTCCPHAEGVPWRGYSEASSSFRRSTPRAVKR